MAPFGNSFGLQAVPILLPEAAGGHLVLCDPFWRVIALDPVSGEVAWEMTPEPAVQKGLRDLQYKCRGVSQWEDTEAEDGALCKWRIFQVTGDRRMFAMDAKTGKLCPGFGDGGTVVMDEAIGSIPHAHDVTAIRTYFPPAVVSDTVISGSVVGTKFHDAHAPSGAVYAFDARTGALKWTFDPVPRNPGDPEAANWTAEGLATTGGGNVWTYMTTDPGARPRVSADVEPIAELLRHQPARRQSVCEFHRRLTRFDRRTRLAFSGRASRRLGLGRVARTIGDRPDVERRENSGDRAADQAGTHFVFHRETGENRSGRLRKCPSTPTASRANRLSPTQPFPEKPAPLAKFITTEDDAWGFTFLDRMVCKEVWRKYRHGTLFTPPSPEGTIIQPGMVNNWGGGAFDPERNLLITNVRRFSLFIGLPRTDTIDLEAAKNPQAGFPGGPPKPIKGTPNTRWSADPKKFFRRCFRRVRPRPGTC